MKRRNGAPKTGNKSNGDGHNQPVPDGAVKNAGQAPQKGSTPKKSRTKQTESGHRLNLRFLIRMVRLAKPYWFSSEKKSAWLLVSLLLVLLIGYTQFAVLFNQQSGEITSALAARDSSRFRHAIVIFFGLIVAGVPIDAFYYLVRDRLALNWRRWITERILERYFGNHKYYQLLSISDIDNPDQRISEDINSFTDQSLALALVFANGLLQLLAFGHVLWSISNYLVIFLFGYAAVITAVTIGVFGEKMVSLYFSQRRREADFRFGLVRIRENAEAIGLYRGERLEQQRLKQVFGRLFENRMQIIRWSLGLNFFYYTNELLAMILPTLIIAPRVLSGELEVGRIVQATGAFAAILAALTLIVDHLQDLSQFAASVGRLETLARALSREPVTAGSQITFAGKGGSARKQAGPALEPARIRVQEGAELAFDSLTLRTPNSQRVLIEGLTASVPEHKGLMILGPSGIGKSSLFRAIAGLWDCGDGTLIRPKFEDMLFLPQHPYMIMGSLRDQLNYPNLNRALSDDELREVLERVNLAGLIDRCGGMDQEFDWERILSAGERQRLALARAFLKAPRYVFLDEASSALDRDNEADLYQKLIATSITVVTVSHHAELVKYHSQILELKGDGQWQLHPADKFRFAEHEV